MTPIEQRAHLRDAREREGIVNLATAPFIAHNPRLPEKRQVLTHR